MTEEKKPKAKSLSRKKQIADQINAEMKKFTCVSCGKENFDMGSYFYDKPSIKCLWCSKFPSKTKKTNSKIKDA